MESHIADQSGSLRVMTLMIMQINQLEEVRNHRSDMVEKQDIHSYCYGNTTDKQR